MTELDFGRLVLGGGVFGWTADEATSFRVLDAFVDAGGRSIDTADSYAAWVDGNSGGESETIIGNWLARSGKRDQVILATKVCWMPSRLGLAADNIRLAIDESLTRLRTDAVDVYYAHRDDPSVEQMEYLTAFDELVRAGKVRELGACEFPPDRLVSARAIADEHGLTPFTISQDEWNLVERRIEGDKLYVLRQLGMVELPYQALASGFLTGKYQAGTEVDSQRSEYVQSYLERPFANDLLTALADVANDHRVSIAAVALAWLREQDPVAAPITSARTPEQLPALLESVQLDLTAAEVNQLSAITA